MLSRLGPKTARGAPTRALGWRPAGWEFSGVCVCGGGAVPIRACGRGGRLEADLGRLGAGLRWPGGSEAGDRAGWSRGASECTTRAHRCPRAAGGRRRALLMRGMRPHWDRGLRGTECAASRVSVHTAKQLCVPDAPCWWLAACCLRSAAWSAFL